MSTRNPRARKSPSKAPSKPASRRHIQIVVRSPDDIKPNPKNPRVHSPKQVRQVADSIKQFGFVTPLLLDKNLRLIAGHGRLEAAKLLGLRDVPTVLLDHLTEAQAQALMLADNKLALNAEWNEKLLAEQLKELSELKLDFSLELTGFEMGEIDFLIESLAPRADSDDPADLLPTASGPDVTVLGDLWICGASRVLCGSALEESAYSKLLEAQKASMIITDPPFNVPVHGHVSGRGAIKHREFVMASGEMSEEEFTQFLASAFLHMKNFSQPGSLHYHFIDWRHLAEMLAAGRQAYSELVNLCVWAKTNAGMGSFYRSAHELVFVFRSGGKASRNNVQLGRFGRYRTNVWAYPGANSFARGNEEGNLLELHPTVKPVALIADAIMDSTARGDLVLDAFLGSGTTLIAAEKTGRRCYGIELDARYVDVIVRRWQKFTGKRAVHAQTGRSFHDLEKQKQKKTRGKPAKGGVRHGD